LALNLDSALIGFFVHVLINLIILSPVLWVAGRLLAGKNAKFTDALWIVFLGTLVFDVFGYVFSYLFTGIIASLISGLILLIIWLSLVKHFFDCGWLKALAISIIAIVFLVIIVVILGIILVAVGIGAGWLPNISPF
jgi:hypothetical protein